MPQTRLGLRSMNDPTVSLFQYRIPLVNDENTGFGRRYTFPSAASAYASAFDWPASEFRSFDTAFGGTQLVASDTVGMNLSLLVAVELEVHAQIEACQ